MNKGGEKLAEMITLQKAFVSYTAKRHDEADTSRYVGRSEVLKPHIPFPSNFSKACLKTCLEKYVMNICRPLKDKMDLRSAPLPSFSFVQSFLPEFKLFSNVGKIDRVVAEVWTDHTLVWHQI